MKYYSLRHSVKLKEVGSFPQGGKLAGNLTLETIRKLPFYSESNEEIQFEIILNDKAKLTDYINQGAFYHPGLLVSSSLFEKTIELNYFKFQCYQVSIFLRNILFNEYVFIRPIYDDLLCVNFHKSDLFFYNPLHCFNEIIIEEDKVKIENLNIDFVLSYVKENPLYVLGADCLVLQKYFIDRDLFYFRFFGSYTIIASERFVDSIKINKFTGFEICDVPFDIKFE